MFRRKKLAQLAKNIIAESERVIEFGEDAPYSLDSTDGWSFRDRLCRVVAADVRIWSGGRAR
jgi:hypothetical protein